MSKKKRKFNLRKSKLIANRFEKRNKDSNLFSKFKHHFDYEMTTANTKVIDDNSLIHSELKDAPKTVPMFNNDGSGFIVVLNDNMLFYNEIIDLSIFRLTGENRFLFAIDFMGWFNSFVEEYEKVAYEPNDLSILFISENELEFSVVIQCQSIMEGFEIIGRAKDQNTKKSHASYQEYADKYDTHNLICSEDDKNK